MTASIPGGVYLCQVSETISCGACCGLYNIPDLSRSRLSTLLIERTERLQNVPRTEDGLDDFALQEIRRLGPDRPYLRFHHCPFLGLIGPKQSRVGCLLHPLVAENAGIDYRGYSYYGAAACRLYFCPSYYRLPARFKRVLQSAGLDWYGYGLLITEHTLIQAIFQEVEHRLGRDLDARDGEENPRAQAWVHSLVELKETWPFRPSHAAGPCHYVFEDEEAGRIQACFPQGETHPIRFAPILQELETTCSTREELEAATEHVDDMLNSMVQALSSPEAFF